MNRLTKDLNTPHDDTTYADVVANCCDKEDIVLTKLKHYEDIEEELGIDLITLFKALKNGIYLKFGSEKITGVYYEHRAILPRHFDKDYKGYFIDLQLELSINFNFYFKDYGKTWALTKEELENE